MEKKSLVCAIIPTPDTIDMRAVLTHFIEGLGKVGEHVWHEILQHLVETIQVLIHTHDCVMTLNAPLGLL